MFKALFEGILLGLTVAILIGPSFFALIQTSMESGFRSGLALAFGIFLSDVVCVVLVYLGASQLLDNPHNKEIMGIAGGILLIIFGTFNLLQKKRIEEKDLKIKNLNLHWSVTKGFFLNILNPFTSLFWLGAITLVSSKDDTSVIHFITFFTGTLLTVFAIDVLKAYIARKIRNSINEETLAKVNRIAGLILILFGISLIYRVFD